MDNKRQIANFRSALVSCSVNGVTMTKTTFISSSRMHEKRKDAEKTSVVLRIRAFVTFQMNKSGETLFQFSSVFLFS